VKRTFAILGLVGLVLLASVGLGLFRRTQRSMAAQRAVRERLPAVRVARVERRLVALHEDFYGLIEPAVRVELAFRIGGRVESLATPADDPSGLGPAVTVEGMRVRAGQGLARLEDKRLVAAVSQAKAMLDQAQAALAAARGQARHARAAEEAARGRVAEAEACQQEALDEYARVMRLAKQGHATETELDRVKSLKQQADARMRQVRAALAQAAAAVQAADAQVARAEATVAQAEAALRAAELDLSYATLRSPIDGVVTAVRIEEGETVAPGQPVITVMDLSRVKLVVGVVERKVPLLRAGQSAEVTVEALGTSRARGVPGRSFQGRITQVSPAANERTGLFDVEIELDNAEGLLRPGMVGRARVVTGKRDCYLIPVDAAISKDGRLEAFFVQVDEAGSPAVRSVVLGVVGQTSQAYLVESLDAGCRYLVVEGHHQVRDGQVVTVVNDAELQALTGGPGRPAGQTSS